MVQGEGGLQGFQKQARAALALYLAGSGGSSVPWPPGAGCPAGRAGRSAGSRSPPHPGTRTPGTAPLPSSPRPAGGTRLQKASFARHAKGETVRKRDGRHFKRSQSFSASSSLRKDQLEKNSHLSVLPHLGQRKGSEQRKAQHRKNSLTQR